MEYVNIRICRSTKALLDEEGRKSDTYGEIVQGLICEVRAWRLAHRIQTWNCNDIRTLKSLLEEFAAEAGETIPGGVDVYAAYGINMSLLPSEEFDDRPGWTIWAVDREGRALVGEDFVVLSLAEIDAE